MERLAFEPAVFRRFLMGGSAISTPRPLPLGRRQVKVPPLRVPLGIKQDDYSIEADARRAELATTAAQINPAGFRRPKGWGKKESRRDRAGERKVSRELMVKKYHEIREAGIAPKYMNAHARAMAGVRAAAAGGAR